MQHLHKRTPLTGPAPYKWPVLECWPSMYWSRWNGQVGVSGVANVCTIMQVHLAWTKWANAVQKYPLGCLPSFTSRRTITKGLLWRPWMAKDLAIPYRQWQITVIKLTVNGVSTDWLHVYFNNTLDSSRKQAISPAKLFVRQLVCHVDLFVCHGW